MRIKHGIAYAAVGLASVGAAGLDAEMIHDASKPSAAETEHISNAAAIKTQIDQLPDDSDAILQQLRTDQAYELIEVSTNEWERDNMRLFGLLTVCAAGGAMVLGGAKIYIDYSN